MKPAIHTPNKQRPLIAVAELSFFFLALVSLGYSVVTAPGQGKDLAMFQDMGRAWLIGSVSNG